MVLGLGGYYTEQAIELSKDFNKMVAKLIEELDVEALLAKSIEFI